MVQNVVGFPRIVFSLYIRLIVFFHVTLLTLRGRVARGNFFCVLRRLEFFLKKMRDNKFVAINGRTRVGLYIPGAPSQAFNVACDKFTVFGEKLPGTTVLVSITSACVYNCPHCYQRHDRGADIDIGKLVEVVLAMLQQGVTFVNIEGGEPFMVFDRLLAVCEAIDRRAEIWINSTGYGISKERLLTLREMGVIAIMFPLHFSTAAATNAFMGSDRAWDIIDAGIAHCHDAGVAVAFNMCLARDQFFNGEFERCMEIAHVRKAAIVQIIKPKPAGGWLDGGASVFTAADLDAIREKVHHYNRSRKYQQYPAISAQVLEEDATLFGCTCGGTDRYYLNAKGDVQPCEFVNVSFGNIKEEAFETIYRRMRSAFTIPGTRWLCEQYAPEVAQWYRKYQCTSLPLNKEMTEELVAHWDRGPSTPLYDVLEGRK